MNISPCPDGETRDIYDQKSALKKVMKLPKIKGVLASSTEYDSKSEGLDSRISRNGLKRFRSGTTEIVETSRNNEFLPPIEEG